MRSAAVTSDAEAEAEIGRHEQGGQDHARGPRGQRDESRTKTLLDPGREDPGIDEDEDPERERSRERQDPKQAHHPCRLAAAPRLARTRRWYRRRAGRWYPDISRGAPAARFAAAGTDCYTPGVLDRYGGDPTDDRRPTIALEGRIGRPVRRPGDQQTAIRRSVGGATREITNLVPDRQVRALLMSCAGGRPNRPGPKLPWPPSGRPWASMTVAC